MSRNRSYKTQKYRYARRKAKRAASAAAKPAPAHAKPGASPAQAPSKSPESPSKQPKPPKPTPGLALVRRAAHQDRKLKARVRLLEKRTARLEGLEKHLHRALEVLAAARRQVGELNAAMNYLLHQEPHGGRYFDEFWGRSEKWTRKDWQCPVRWDDQD